jgi:hypothetical protein
LRLLTVTAAGKNDDDDDDDDDDVDDGDNGHFVGKVSKELVFRS